MSEHTCQEVLRKHMSPAQYELFAALTANLSAFPCEYNQQSGQFEPALDTLDPETTESDTLDAVLTACDILSSHVEDVNLRNVCQVAPPEAGSAELVYDFDTDEPALPAFLALLRPLETDAAYQIDVRRQAGVTQVFVTIRFYGEQDYQSKKDRVHLLHDIADRRVKERPFHGNRL